MVEETTLAILKMQGSRAITIVSLHRKLVFDIKVNPYWPKGTIQSSKLAAKNFESSEFHHNMWNSYLILGFVSAHIPRNTVSTLKLRWSYTALWKDVVLPSATTLSNIRSRESALTVDAIIKQLLSRNTVRLPLDRWKSTNKLSITSVIGYYMDRH